VDLFGRSPRSGKLDEKLAGVLVVVAQTAADVQQQYDESGRPDHLEFAIRTWTQLRGLVEREPQAAIAVLGRDMVARALNELGLDLLQAGMRESGIMRLHEAAQVLRAAAEWAEPGSGWRTRTLANASHVLMVCWERSGSPADLDSAVAAGEAAVAAAPAADATCANAMNVFGNALRTRGRSPDRTSDLRRAVEAHGQAVAITGVGTPDTARFLVNLGRAQQALAAATGDRAMLDAAVTTFGRARREVRDERDLIPALEGLRESLATRGTQDDLRAAADVLETLASAHADVPALAALDLIGQSHVLRSLASATKDVDALDGAVAAARRARDFAAPNPEVLSTAGEALADALSDRFEFTRSRRDLDEAIALRQQAVTGDPSDV
jgi:tetratricopeptide (TPR) repeat protein